MSILQSIQRLWTPKQAEKRESFEQAFLNAGYVGGSHRHLVAIPAPAYALRNSVVNNCVSLIATTISTLPLRVIDRTTKKEAVNHPLSIVLDNPNDEQTGVELLEMFLVNFCLWGAAYLEKEITRGRITGLYPMASPRVVVMRDQGQVWYEYFPPTNKSVVINGSNVVALRWPGHDDLAVTSPVWCAETAIRLAMTQESMLLDYFGSGARQDFIISLPPEKALERLNSIRPEELQAEKQLLQNQIEGAMTKRGLYVPFGYEVSNYSTNYQQAQVTEIRDSQVLDIARFWRVPTSKLGVLSKVANGSQTEAERIGFFQDCIGPIVTKLEKRLEASLLSDADRQKYQITFNVAALLRADTQQQTLQNVQYLQCGIKTRNELRAELGLMPFDDGESDKPFTPTNLSTDSIGGGFQGTNPNQGAIAEPGATPQDRSADAIAKCVRKEASMIMKDATTILAKRSPENLKDRLKELYSGELATFVRTQLDASYAQTYLDDSLAELIEVIDGGTTNDEILTNIGERMNKWAKSGKAGFVTH